MGIDLIVTEVNPVASSCGDDRLRFSGPSSSAIRFAPASPPPHRARPRRPRSGRLIEKVEVLNQRDEVVLACEYIHVVEERDT